MTNLKSKTAATTAAIALLATPAFAAKPTDQEPRGKGQETSPAKLCKDESRKKTRHGKGKSPFAACVVGAKRQEREAEKRPVEDEQRAPGQICGDKSRKKDQNDEKSAFAACVTGVTEMRKAQREQEQEQEQETEQQS